jgi:hypothetical protein
MAADRPLIATIVLTFGLTALAVMGVSDPGASSGARWTLVSSLAGAAAMFVVPFASAAIAPLRLWQRLAFVAAVAAVAILAIVFAPFDGVKPAILAAPAFFAVILVGFFPFFGPVARQGFLAILPTLLGLAGAVGFLSMRHVIEDTLLGPTLAVALALGASIGFSSVAEFAAAFSRGADRRLAAGKAASENVGPFAFDVLVAAAAFGALTGGTSMASFSVASLAGAAALLTGVIALFAATGALALKKPSEALAAEENWRRQSFRQFWRPIRAALPPSSASAVVAIVAIVIIAIAFYQGAPVTISHVLFMTAAGALASLIFFSLRSGVLVFFLLIAGLVLSKWIWGLASAGGLGRHDEAAVLALVAALFGQLALSWREARNPRLNARETTEAAMSSGARLYITSALSGMASFLAMDVAGVWPMGAEAAAEAGVILTIGLLMAPAVMTTLSSAVRRELA